LAQGIGSSSNISSPWPAASCILHRAPLVALQSALWSVSGPVMGNAAPVADNDLPDALELPCDDVEHWKAIKALDGSPMKSFDNLLERMAGYCSIRGLGGLEAALPEDHAKDFFAKTLPCIVQRALALPALHHRFQSHTGGSLPFLRQDMRAQVRIPREFCASLLANMFLCTFDANHTYRSMPSPSFCSLLQNASPQSPEVAKLKMFLHYFKRIGDDVIPGELVIDRVVGVALNEKAWHASDMPLLPLEFAPPLVGFETAPELAHADFANMFIGGGVLSGGCVQEEIRFSICPELCVSMLLCPCMKEGEAIQIVGAEQYSSYAGYAFSLTFAGDWVDQARRGPDGSVRTAVLAMDAIDLRRSDRGLAGQLSSRSMLRELNKSLAAFTPVDEESLRNFPRVATGNWGCGAFGGCAPLKALLQWASASQCGRRLRYFPFDEGFGPVLEDLSDKYTKAGGATVGQLLRILSDLRVPKEMMTLDLRVVSDKLGERSKGE